MSTALGLVEPYQQVTKFSCSAATMHAVLSHYGIVMNEAQLAPLIGLTSDGAWPWQIVQASHRLGLPAFEMRFTIPLAKTFTQANVPVIADVESWNMPGRGHFVVLVNIGSASIEAMDPNTPGNWRSIPMKELAQRWAYSGWSGVVILPPRG